MTTDAGTADTTASTATGGTETGANVDTQLKSQADPAKVQAELVSTPFGDLEKDTAEWLTKREVKDTPSLIKLARDKDSMVGKQADTLAKAIVPPGKDAKPEEIKAFREKMGVPLDPDGYELKAPANLPDDLPYDGERAKAFMAKAHELNVPKSTAQALHDWFTDQVVADYSGDKAKQDEAAIKTAADETAKLTKLYGPVSGEQFKAQAAFADKALMEIGGEEALAEFKRVGLIGDGDGQKIVQSAAVFNMLAKIGQTLFKEGEVLKGDPSRLDNPFMEGPNFNVTRQMQVTRADRPLALSMIQAAGKKPSDFGLTA